MSRGERLGADGVALERDEVVDEVARVLFAVLFDVDDHLAVDERVGEGARAVARRNERQPLHLEHGVVAVQKVRLRRPVQVHHVPGR